MEENGNTLSQSAELAEQQAIIPLDDAAIEALADYDRQILAANAAKTGVLAYVLRLNRVAPSSGGWRLAENGRELVRG